MSQVIELFSLHHCVFHVFSKYKNDIDLAKILIIDIYLQGLSLIFLLVF